MNNEPVAWMNRLGRLKYEQGNGFEIPLYTHPAKTLTDEEIHDLIVNKVTDADMIREALKKANK